MRSAHRTAISNTVLRKLNVVRVFLLAEIPEKEKFITQEAVESEHRHFNDIVQGVYTNIGSYQLFMSKISMISSICRKFPRSIP